VATRMPAMRAPRVAAIAVLAFAGAMEPACSPRQVESDPVHWTGADTSGGPTSYEYIIVGSGAGGGPLAANLARAGHTVLLLEAGDDQGGNINYQVPAFHTLSTEDPSMRWDYFVNHYDNAAQANLDSKMTRRAACSIRAPARSAAARRTTR